MADESPSRPAAPPRRPMSTFASSITLTEEEAHARPAAPPRHKKEGDRPASAFPLSVPAPTVGPPVSPRSASLSAPKAPPRRTKSEYRPPVEEPQEDAFNVDIQINYLDPSEADEAEEPHPSSSSSKESDPPAESSNETTTETPPAPPVEVPKLPDPQRAEKQLLLTIQEMLSTEVTFFYHMKQTKRSFYDQLKDKSASWAQQVREQLTDLAFESVTNTSGELVQQFRSFIDPEEKIDPLKSEEETFRYLEEKVDALSQTLIKYAPFLRVFVPYCNHYDRVLKNFTKLLSNSSSFSEFHDARKQEIGLPLADLLIMPVQRICRYPILLGAIKGALPKGRTYPNFERCIAEIQKIAGQVNERQRDGENRTKVVEIQNSLLEVPDQMKLVVPNRLFLAENRINYIKTTRKQRGVDLPVPKEKREWILTLFNDAILIAKQRKRLRSGLSTQSYFRDLLKFGEDIKIYRCADTNRVEVLNNRLNLNEIHVLIFASQAEKASWIKKLENNDHSLFVSQDSVSHTTALFATITAARRRRKEEKAKELEKASHEALIKTPSTDINPALMGLANAFNGATIRLKHSHPSNDELRDSPSPNPQEDHSPSPDPPHTSSSSSSSSSQPPVTSGVTSSSQLAAPPPPELFIPVPPEYEDNPKVQELVQSITHLNKKIHNLKMMRTADITAAIDQDRLKYAEMLIVLELLQDKYGITALDPIISNFGIYKHSV
eukprot:TRINITY_DN5752_c0_g1_i1.p1 TRINITY_DN5752_c0_g1~~TRINITY_DN5752_c0_g1_i1.p1  ORF type:complete len:735 (-),score=299.71 TRINITY_DN5752_c0_g1_i1:114-2273(-)